MSASLYFDLAYAATFSVSNDDPFERYILYLDGEIQTGDAKKFARIVAMEKWQMPYAICLNSTGGNVAEAMKIGRYVREAKLTTCLGTPTDNTICASACFLIWASGVRRWTTGTIGLHRPSFPPELYEDLSFDETDRLYDEMAEDVKTYLQEMDIADVVIERMFSTSSSRIDILEKNEIRDLIGEYDPGFQEWQIGKCGELSDSEEADLRAIVSADQLQEAVKELGVAATEADRLTASISIQILKPRAERANTLSDGYKEYLWNKQADINDCIDTNLFQDRLNTKEKIRRAFLPAVDADSLVWPEPPD